MLACGSSGNGCLQVTGFTVVVMLGELITGVRIVRDG